MTLNWEILLQSSLEAEEWNRRCLNHDPRFETRQILSDALCTALFMSVRYQDNFIEYELVRTQKEGTMGLFVMCDREI